MKTLATLTFRLGTASALEDNHSIEEATQHQEQEQQFQRILLRLKE